MSKNLKSAKAMALEIKVLVAKEEQVNEREFLNKVEVAYRLYIRNRM